MRRNTGLSYDKSQVAVGTVLSHLRENVPGIRNVMDDILKDILKVSAIDMFGVEIYFIPFIMLFREQFNQYRIAICDVFRP